MPDNEQIKELILASKREAAAEMAQIKGRVPLTREFLTEHLRRYVLRKYMLTDADGAEEDFHALTELSLSRSMKISKELVKEYDLAKSCDGTSSVMAKKVLLFMAIQRDLDITLPARETVRFRTLDELAELVFNTMQTSPAWQGRLS